MLGIERRETARAVGTAVCNVAEVVQDIQLGIARRAFDRAGMSNTPMARAHSGHIKGVHLAICGITKITTGVTGVALEATAPTEATSVSASAGGAKAIGIITSFYGDSMESHGSALAPGMSMFVDGRQTKSPIEPLSPEALRQEVPDATNDLVVFVHGMCCTEYSWGTDESFATRLRAQYRLTPILVRYNTGSHISTNGDRLDAALEHLVESWPTDVHSITLVGHSMGALVIRSACATASESGAAWVGLVESAVYLGAPHSGAPLEKVVALAAGVLNRDQVTRALARFLNQRSAGIKDLRHGSLRPHHHTADSPHDRDLEAHTDLPLLPHIRHLSVAATIAPVPTGLIANSLGDGMVSTKSATGRPATGPRADFPGEISHYVVGTHHLGLTTASQVYDIIDAAIADGGTVPRIAATPGTASGL